MDIAKPQVPTTTKPKVKKIKMHVALFAEEADTLFITLPLTRTKSEARLKRPQTSFAPAFVFPGGNKMANGDYLEWQISYDTALTSEPSAIKTVTFQRNGKTRYACELIWLLVQAVKKKMITKDDFNKLSELLASEANGIQELEKVGQKKQEPAPEWASKNGYASYFQMAPNHLLVRDSYSLEIKISQQQVGVHNQAMIYLHLPLTHCNTTTTGNGAFWGRSATKSEKVKYTITKDNVNLISDTITAFALASKTHRKDLRTMFTQLSTELFKE